MAAIMEFGLGTGSTGFTIVLETWWLPRLEDQGWVARPLGLPQPIDGMSVIGIFVDCDEETWIRNCERPSMMEPTLRWDGLNTIDRKALPLLPGT